eukprot:CAMPEP_0184535094 /NCGR_PEP_ID=MMETSP0198_2-20121128/15702_1 /TAXON_ID=1112570 /ORGANISM="Thraustochytrium sp., Strain LLF1b" /LENGTH=41 /DNA_ID= /DNA_START= /DNA_END= /DNA_ORIENTATION=
MSKMVIQLATRAARARVAQWQAMPVKAIAAGIHSSAGVGHG